MCDKCAATTRQILHVTLIAGGEKATGENRPEIGAMLGRLAKMIEFIDSMPDGASAGGAIMGFLTTISTDDLITLGKACHYSYEVFDILDDACYASLVQRAQRGDKDALELLDVSTTREGSTLDSMFGGGKPGPMVS